MNSNTRARWAGIALVCFALAACGGGDSQESTPGTGLIGAAGGTVTGTGGAKVIVASGALAQDTTISVAQSSTGAPPLPAGVTAFGPMFAFTPHGTTFAVPVTITLPFDLKSVPAGSMPALFKTNAQNQWEHVPTATFKADSLSAKVTSFSNVQVVIPPLTSANLVRVWSFREYRGDALEEVEVAGDTQIGGHLEEFFDHGPAFFDTGYLFDDGTELAPDGIATSTITSFADGVTYSVGAEAPIGHPALEEPIGSKARLVQYQTFTKNAPDASYAFTLTQAFVEVVDGNSVLGRKCPPAHDVLEGVACDLILGEVYLDVHAFTDDPGAPKTTLFRTAGGATVNGGATPNTVNNAKVSWTTSAWNEAFSRSPLWTTEHFNFEFSEFNGPEGHLLMDLANPRTYRVDISSVPVGHKFTVKVVTHAFTYNRAAKLVSGVGTEFETAANAYLRDPLSIGGATVTTTGLTLIDTPLPLADPVEAPVQPAPCVPGPGPDPAAGVLQFSAAVYTLGESSTTPKITVTRTGGSRGAVTATFTTSDGSAVAGADYTPVTASVFFADGDAVPRVVAVPIVQDKIAEPDKTVNLTLSQPGGCAALGARTTAALTIRDDDSAPALPSGLDPTFGTAGEAAMPETGTPPRGFGGDRSAMALQADGKIVMVGGTFTDFILARFNADGSLDTTFGIDGKVTTDMGGGPFEQEEALGVAIQTDGKIVVVGHTSIPTVPPAPNLPPTFALARYNSNGSLDTGFGTGGRVSANVNGIAYAVAIQPDGKIVVAGEFSFASSNGSDFSDFTLARFNTNGSLDLGFGGSGTGQVATDVGSSTNSARNLVLQPNGAIVVSGKPPGDQPGFDHTDIARYTASGVLDASFGSGGKLTLAGVDVGQGLARQSDGKFVLVGSVVNNVAPATARFLLKRLNINGTLDTTFGNAGTVDTAFAQNAIAGGVALQADGRIVVVGTRVFSANANFVVARYNDNGSVDTGFGSDGNLSIDFFGFTDIGENVLVQSDGKILVSGQAQRNFDGYGLARINP